MDQMYSATTTVVSMARARTFNPDAPPDAPHPCCRRLRVDGLLVLHIGSMRCRAATLRNRQAQPRYGAHLSSNPDNQHRRHTGRCQDNSEPDVLTRWLTILLFFNLYIPNQLFACLDGLVASKIIKLSVLASIMLKYWQNHVPHAWCCNIAFGL